MRRRGSTGRARRWIAQGLAWAALGLGGGIGCNAILGFEPGQAGQPCMEGVVARQEACNGFDDDCDRLVDEDCPCVDGAEQECRLGPPGQDGVGICRAGTQVCEAGAWGPCEGAVVPSAEVMNGADDDCNGVTDDDGSTCASGEAQSCYEGPGGVKSAELEVRDGACKAGTQACVGGAWGPCGGGLILPAREACDGIDNDCDGMIDEGDPDLGGECFVDGRVGECARGTWTCKGNARVCEPVLESAQEEICGDDKDNDCDGHIDEVC